MLLSTSERSLFLIDASIFIFRYYFSPFTPDREMVSLSGRPTQTTFQYLQWLVGMLHRVRPGRAVACFDESLHQCFRNDIFPNYKSSRALPDDDLMFELLACKKITSLLGLHCVASERYEADDLIATYVEYCVHKKHSCCILTRDKDLGQLVRGDDIVIWDYPRGERMGSQQIESKMGVRPEQIPDYLAIAGDASDDIPGVPGIGPKTAANLLAHFDNWSAIKANIHRVHCLPIRGAASVEDKLKAYVSEVDMYLQLTTAARDTMPVVWRDTLRRGADVRSLEALSESLGFPPSINQKLRDLEAL